ncbi:MerR family transcriptional regulator [Algiphilus sp. W345]|uniref:MerR family transcriptional regulator n=1 Tax=Banduia mediterranea TaxID=3075609 RepID=A0ABU2WH70_9GAMM|nr:MerR family transcriptional regulator [Algiphilus sp. W345]MDT0496422.1 MerR family transcriptional regulator [Algiphilus sp. W345]
MARRRTAPPEDAPYKIKGLSEISGFRRETIRFYVLQGLLPPPVKTSPNMGWYTDRHVKLLALIRKLQNERFLPLKAIKSLVQGSSGEFEFSEQQMASLGELRRALAAEHQDVVVTEDPGELAPKIGLTTAELEELRSLGFAGSGAATISDLEVARLWLRMKEAGLSEKRGFSPADLGYLVNLVDSAVNCELEFFLRRIDYMAPAEIRKLVEVIIPSINAIFSILHERRLDAQVQTYVENARKRRYQ